MLTVEERTRRFKRTLRGSPAPQNGDRLRSQEFLRHYEAMPELKKAELIEEIVYGVWRTLERRFDWFVLENENYVPLRPAGRGLLHSRVFPGLVLDVSALLAMNAQKILAVLQ